MKQPGKELKKESGKNKTILAFRGSFTIEASFLLPLLVFLIWNIVYLALFLYNQCTAMQGCYCTALRTERLVSGAEEKDVLAVEKFDASVRKKMAAAEVWQEISRENNGVKVEAGLTMRAPGGYFFQSIWSGQHKQTAQAWEPVTFIRKCRKAEKLLDGIQQKETDSSACLDCYDKDRSMVV